MTNKNKEDMFREYSNNYVLSKQIDEINKKINKKENGWIIPQSINIIITILYPAVSVVAIFILSFISPDVTVHSLAYESLFMLVLFGIFFNFMCERKKGVSVLKKNKNEMLNNLDKKKLNVEEYIEDYTEGYLIMKEKNRLFDINKDCIDELLEKRLNLSKTFKECHDSFNLLNEKNALLKKAQKNHKFLAKAMFGHCLFLIFVLVFKIVIINATFMGIIMFLSMLLNGVLGINKSEEVFNLEKEIKDLKEKIKPVEDYKSFYKKELLKFKKSDIEKLNKDFLNNILMNIPKEDKEKILKLEDVNKIELEMEAEVA